MQFGGAGPQGPRFSMSRRLVVGASVVVDLLGRFRPEPIEALPFAAAATLAA